MPTNDYSKNIVYLSKEQYQELITNETLTVNGQTITYNDNDIYVTPQAEPITDVKLAGTSIGSNGVANIPIATDTTLGVIKRSTGLYCYSDGRLVIDFAGDYQIRDGATLVTTPVSKQHQSVFYGLAKAAGDTTQKNYDVIGTYTDTAKQKIQNMLGVTDLISTEESSTATAAHALNSTFMMNGKLHRATAAIAVGDAVEVGTNCEVVKADEVFVKKTDYATLQIAGIIKPAHGLQIYNGDLSIRESNSAQIKAGRLVNYPITISRQHEAAFYGLAKVAGADEKDSELPLGTYSAAAKAAIQTMLGVPSATSIPTATSDLTNDTYYVSASFDNNNGLVLATAASWAEEASF